MKNRKLACFKNINCEKIKINYKDNKYECNFEFSNPYLKLSFIFNDLNFFEKDDNFLITAKELILPDFTLKNFEKYKSLKYIKYENITIHTIEEYKKFIEMNIHCFDIKCSPILMDFSENYCLKKEPQSSDINNEKFYIHLNLNNLNNIMKLDFSGGKIQMINFLSDECLTNLEELNLSNNKIEDISFLTEQNIKCKKITKVNLSENPVRKGLEVLNQKFFTDRYLYIEVFNVIEKEDEYFISLNFQDPLWDSCVTKSRDKTIGFKEFYLDIYLKDLNHLWNYVDEKYTFFSYGLLRLQKLGLIKEEDYNLKYEIFVFLSNLPNFFHTLKL